MTLCGYCLLQIYVECVDAKGRPTNPYITHVYALAV